MIVSCYLRPHLKIGMMMIVFGFALLSCQTQRQIISQAWSIPIGTNEDELWDNYLKDDVIFHFTLADEYHYTFVALSAHGYLSCIPPGISETSTREYIKLSKPDHRQFMGLISKYQNIFIDAKPKELIYGDMFYCIRFKEKFIMRNISKLETDSQLKNFIVELDRFFRSHLKSYSTPSIQEHYTGQIE